jgi:hypothetical protein
MAIQVNGCTVIDDGRNIVNVNDIRVGLVTITSNGNINTPGTVTASSLSVPPRPIAFSPIDDSTGQSSQPSSLVIVFDQVITKGTGNITLRSGSASGTILQTIGAASTNVVVSQSTVSISGLAITSILPSSTDIFVVVDAGAFKNIFNTNSNLIDTYNFTTKVLSSGDPVGGGNLLCRSGGVYWIVAPAASQINCSWYSISSAITTAQQISGRSGWFIPTVSQLQNPGYACRSFWEGGFSGDYWSCACGPSANTAFFVCCINGQQCAGNRATPRGVRAFRCVTY